ncbi:hypothetical protein MCOR02_003782 [Pyricularia oryzae]|uniref:Uncharacterized protein n=1 Tax=Pyricularia grisea TaxID=148305 RepID=A0ABQ8NPD5_PYRGI|nr:hypothetical protein MCOR02_003782 [Pyricularia oryzae]KAI6300163.1 hypothetical protein MCOR33_004056 [Pyricularia grisea]KAI6253767.1 hypothetical protein MCOR19_009697 [Pyricularia oryzae]KAI6268863.1 hypothetical protein MCOR26_008997 [Pyricularia oryzae]KAI6294532.1 hypothetical protein MCOR34_009709 [Pyricularia oryzae]
MIARINPMVSLAVLKLWDEFAPDGTRIIYSEAAAQAIRCDVCRKVYVIPMSWRMRSKTSIKASKDQSMPTDASMNRGEAGASQQATIDRQTMAIRELEQRIDEVDESGIIMFCSASDDIAAGETLLFCRKSNSIIRIGGVIQYGQRDPISEDPDSISYYFPGNQVAEAKNPFRDASKVRYHDSSSVGTALAAGLASLVTHCAIMLRDGRPVDIPHYPDAQALVEALRKTENVRLSFDSVFEVNDETEGWRESNDLPVWALFGKAAEMESLRDYERWGVLAGLMKRISAMIK